MRLPSWNLAVAAFGLSVPSILGAQSSAGSLELLVDGPPDPSARVVARVRHLGLAATSDSSGVIRLDGLPAGTHEIVFEVNGQEQGALIGMRTCADQTVRYAVTLGPHLMASAVDAICTTDGIPRSAASLPVDRIADLLALEPGVASLDRGELSVRGAGGDAMATYLDGVPVTPGHRLGGGATLGGSWFGAEGSGIAIGTNGFEQITLAAGVTAAEFGGARGGILGLASRDPASSSAGEGAHDLRLRASWATDAPLGTAHGLDFNRVLLNGDVLLGRLSIAVAAAAEGRGTAQLGLEQNASPVFLANGIDTTVTVSSGAGTTNVDILRFTPSPGIRIPASASSNYALLGRATYALGGSRLQLTAVASQRQSRQFEYLDLYNPAQLRADRSWSRVFTGSWIGNLASRDGFSLGAEAHLSWQTDRSTTGPLSPGSELDSRDPFGGFLIAPLEFRFDAASFPVDDQLIRNFRTHSGRLSPYDLNNTGQYQLISQFRTNPYGLNAGFSEGGGPVGTLRLSEENRLVAKAALNARFGAHQRLRVGTELVGYQERYYQSGLTSQQYADAYVESPKRQALFADYGLALEELSVSIGLRYDRFGTGASRPTFTDSAGHRTQFPRISTMPGFDPADPTALFVKDRAHSRVSPDFQLRFIASPSLTVHGGFGWSAQMPELGQTLAGINTDLAVTTTGHIFGTDLDFERRSLGEVGALFTLNSTTTLDATIWNRRDDGVVRTRLVSQFDPLTKGTTDLLRFVNGAARTARGAELRFSRELGEHGRAWLGYTYTDANFLETTNFGGQFPVDIAIAETRPHVLTGAVVYSTGPDAGALSGLLRNASVLGTFRIGSGTAYTACPVSDARDNGTLSGESCAASVAGNVNGSRLPMMKTLDLKLAKGFRLGATTVTAFADARNLLNWRNVTRVFAQTGRTSNAFERQSVERAQQIDLAAEANRNGHLQADSTIDLTFGGAQDPRGGCAGWQNPSGADATPSCIYLLGAEQRFGNGDHLFTPSEQRRATDAFYLVARGLQNFTSPGRRLRLGIEVQF